MQKRRRNYLRVERPLADRAVKVDPGVRPWMVYVLTESGRKRFSISMAKDVDARVFRHRELIDPALKARTPLLVHTEPFADRHTAIARMKRLRLWSVRELCKLIEEKNPDWRDLSGPVEEAS
ncbi:hypothetical protein GCM10007148_25340 [Parvularcula lutaonensis]|nr:hypothetical protein GCM10007148_25340 [Parvularcula lutaonensis]